MTYLALIPELGTYIPTQNLQFYSSRLFQKVIHFN